MLNKKKVPHKPDIPIKTIEDNPDICVDYLEETVNSAIKTYNLPNCLKSADIAPLHRT